MIWEVACAHRELASVSFLFSYSGSVGVIRMNEATYIYHKEQREQSIVVAPYAVLELVVTSTG